MEGKALLRPVMKGVSLRARARPKLRRPGRAEAWEWGSLDLDQEEDAKCQRNPRWYACR